MKACGSRSGARLRRTVHDTRSDEALVTDLCAGRDEALEVLFHRYVRLVYRIAVSMLRDSGEAEDVTQEVFLDVYRQAGLYDPARGTVKVWLLQYAYHRTLRRKAALRRRASYRGEPLEQIEGMDASARPHLQLTRDECWWVLRAGLAQLPDRQRETLELACLEQLSLRDIADRLRVSLGCARHYYYRGLARLQKWARV